MCSIIITHSEFKKMIEIITLPKDVTSLVFSSNFEQ